MSDEDIMFADWDKIILKNARSRDSKELGNVIAVDDENIILNQDNIEFKIPKSYVEGYRGNAVFLGLNGKDIQDLSILGMIPFRTMIHRSYAR